MKKLIRNIYNLLSISTPYFIIFNYIKNYFPNYRKKKQCLKIDDKIYQNFKSIDITKKWFTNTENYEMCSKIVKYETKLNHNTLKDKSKSKKGIFI